MEEVYGELRTIQKRCEHYRLAFLELQDTQRKLEEQVKGLRAQAKKTKQENEAGLKRLQAQHKQDMQVVEARIQVLEQKEAKNKEILVEQEMFITDYKKRERQHRNKVEMLKIQVTQLCLEKGEIISTLEKASGYIEELLVVQDRLNKELESVRHVNRLFGEQLAKSKKID